MTLREYLDAVRHKTVAVVGIGVSNEPLIRLLLQEGVAVTACDKRTREQLGKLAGELEARGARLQLGPDYLEGLGSGYHLPHAGPAARCAPACQGCGRRQ